MVFFDLYIPRRKFFLNHIFLYSGQATDLNTKISSNTCGKMENLWEEIMFDIMIITLVLSVLSQILEYKNKPSLIPLRS
jgi:hypothetical protein